MKAPTTPPKETVAPETAAAAADSAAVVAADVTTDRTKFKMRVKTNILMDEKQYVPGDTIELTKADALKMPWAVEFDKPFTLDSAISSQDVTETK
jgi:hypothetical protein